MDLLRLRERSEVNDGLGNVPEMPAASCAFAAARRPRQTCGRRNAVGSVDLYASTSFRRLVAAQGTMIAAETGDLDVAMAASDDDQRRAERSYLRYMGAGLEYFASVAVLTVLGVWLDGRFGTSPLLTIVLAFVGFASATWNLVRSVFPPAQPPHDPDEQP